MGPDAPPDDPDEWRDECDDPSREDEDYECEDCIGMKDHGCYCKAMGAVGPGGPLKKGD